MSWEAPERLLCADWETLRLGKLNNKNKNKYIPQHPNHGYGKLPLAAVSAPIYTVVTEVGSDPCLSQLRSVHVALCLSVRGQDGIQNTAGPQGASSRDLSVRFQMKQGSFRL